MSEEQINKEDVELMILESQFEPMVQDLAEKRAKELAAARVAELEGEKGALEATIRECEAMFEAALADNELLHNQIEALTPVDDGQEATPGESAAALEAAENDRKALEAERDELQQAID